MPIVSWYCTHPGEREVDPEQDSPLPEADRCVHPECKPTGPQLLLDAELEGAPRLTLELEDIRRLDIKPGELLVVRVPRTPEPADLERLVEVFGRLLPNNKVFITAADVDLMVLNPQDLTSDLLGIPPQ